MKKTLNLISAVCSAVMLISLAGCNINSVPRQYKKLPDILKYVSIIVCRDLVEFTAHIDLWNKTGVFIGIEIFAEVKPPEVVPGNS